VTGVRVPGPVAPIRTDTSALRPLAASDVRLGPGFWGDRQLRNRDATLAHVHGYLETAGNLANLRAVADSGAATAFQGMVFADSDIYKWLEALAWELARDPAPKLERMLRETTRLLRDAQDGDGYLNSYYQRHATGTRWSDLPSGHELYCLGHLIQAAVADARATGATGLLAVARRFADLAWATFGPDGRAGICGHPEVETALVELYRLTGDARYLRLAARFVDLRGHGLLGPGPFGSAYYQDDVPVREARTLTGHAVRALYLATGAVDVAVETGDRPLLDAVVRQWASTIATKTYLTGGQGSRQYGEAFGDPYELPPDTAYAETCAGIASVMLSWRLLLATGHARYADHIERTLFNLVAASTSADATQFFYVNPLQRRGLTAEGRAAWFHCACCPPNLLRLLASLQSYVATTHPGGVQLHQFAAGHVDTVLPDGRRVAFDVDTDYPWSGRIAVTVVRTGNAPWSLALRVPGWASHSTVTVAGGPSRPEVDQHGYTVVTRRWRVGDVVTLDLDMTPRVVEPHPRIDAIRGCVALERGPLVYCLEQVDQEAGVDLADVAVPATPAPRVAHRDDLLGDTNVLELDGAVRTPATWGGRAYRPVTAAADDYRPTGLIAVPYHQWANRQVAAMRVWIPRIMSMR
jgi:DUF1680 family protein